MFQFSRRYGASLLAALLFCIYSFTNAGYFHNLDEVSLFAVTESVALRGEVDTNAIAWTQWLGAASDVPGAFGNDGEVYSKKGPGTSFFALPWYQLLRLLARQEILLGLFQGMLLWNGLVTALTAVLLWLIAVRLGYNDRTGLLLALMFGVSTIAWPYAKLFLGEPLSALSLLGCYWGLLMWQQSHRARWLWLGGVAGGIAIMTAPAHLPLIVILALYHFYYIWQQIRQQPTPSRQGLRYAQEQSLSSAAMIWGLLYFLAPIALSVGLLLWYNLLRFGNPLETGYAFANGEGFTTPIWQGLWGLLLSPYRGIFWYTPLFLASLFAFPRFIRRQRADGWLLLALNLTLLLLYSVWGVWWGGLVWGPRYLVPLSPFLVLLLAEFLESGEQEDVVGVWRSTLEAGNEPANDKASLVRYDPNFAQTAQSLATARTQMPRWLFAVFVLSTIIQLLAVSLNYVNLEMQRRSLSDIAAAGAADTFVPAAQSVSDFLGSPIIGQFYLLRQGWAMNSDLAWLPANGDVKWLIVLFGIGAIATLLYLLRDWWLLSLRLEPEHPGLPLRFTVILIPLLFVGVWLGETNSDGRYGQAGQGYRLILDRVCAQATAGDSALTLAPSAFPIALNWFGAKCGRNISLYGYASDSASHAEGVAELQRLQSASERLWYISTGVQANDPENSVERWLAQNAYKATDDWSEEFRLVRYATDLQLQGVPSLPHNSQLTDGANNRVTILSSTAPISVDGERRREGSVIPIRIDYQVDGAVDAELRWFVQLLNQQGEAVAQLDTAPDDNYVSFLQLPVNQPQLERAGLLLAPELPPGQYRLIAGLYNPTANGNRLRLADGADFVLLSFITLQ